MNHLHLLLANANIKPNLKMTPFMLFCWVSISWWNYEIIHNYTLSVLIFLSLQKFSTILVSLWNIWNGTKISETIRSCYNSLFYWIIKILLLFCNLSKTLVISKKTNRINCNNITFLKGSWRYYFQIQLLKLEHFHEI